MKTFSKILICNISVLRIWNFVIEILTDHCCGGARFCPRTAVGRPHKRKATGPLQRNPLKYFDVMSPNIANLTFSEFFDGCKIKISWYAERAHKEAKNNREHKEQRIIAKHIAIGSLGPLSRRDHEDVVGPV